MRRLRTWLVVLGLVAFGTGVTNANLLTNGNLDDPGDHEVDLAVGWTLDEYRTSGPADTATFARFANHTPNPNAPGPDPDMTGTGPRVGLWYKNFTGSMANPANADLYQHVPGTPGLLYTLSGWARFEQFYAGGFDLVPSIDPITGEFVLTPGITDTVFAIDFLGPGDALISSEVYDLKDDGGKINNNQWTQHSFSAVAPAGTVEVRARASAINMVATFGGQSAFVDDFELTAIPEPASLALGLLGAIAVAGLVPRR